MNKEQYLMELAERLYITSGIKSVTIDELCQHAGMSKKTFYRYHKDKDELVRKVFIRVITRLKLEISGDGKSVSDVVAGIEQQKLLFRRISALKPIFNDQVLLTYGDAGILITEFKEYFLRNLLEEELHKGIRLGWYRPEIPVSRLADLFLVQIGLVLNYQAYSLELACEAHELCLHGLMTSLARAMVAMN